MELDRATHISVLLSGLFTNHGVYLQVIKGDQNDEGWNSCPSCIVWLGHFQSTGSFCKQGTLTVPGILTFMHEDEGIPILCKKLMTACVGIRYGYSATEKLLIYNLLSCSYAQEQFQFVF